MLSLFSIDRHVAVRLLQIRVKNLVRDLLRQAVRILEKVAVVLQEVEVAREEVVVAREEVEVVRKEVEAGRVVTVDHEVVADREVVVDLEVEVALEEVAVGHQIHSTPANEVVMF